MKRFFQKTCVDQQEKNDAIYVFSSTQKLMTKKLKQKPCDIRVIDNFLPEKDFKTLSDIFFDTNTMWYRTPGISEENSTMDILNPLDNYMFAHMVYNNYLPSSNSWEQVSSILLPAIQKTCMNSFRSLVRVKVNLYPRTHKVQNHPFHTDGDHIVGLRGLLLSFNTCDGYTGFIDGTQVDSVANRAIFFDATEKHHSTSCSNQPIRMNMNINYV